MNMGTIREDCTGIVRQLEPEYLVGRAPACSLRLGQRFVSAQQALIRWEGDGWSLKDLGSLNGTYLDGVRLQPGIGHALARGSHIAFGKRGDEWSLVDDAAPGIMAIPLDGGPVILPEGEMLAVPSGADPEATIYRTADGGWILEHIDESSTAIAPSQMFQVGGRTLRFCCPENVNRTVLATSSLQPELEVRHLELFFAVSRDEEHVHLKVSCSSSTLDLGSRGHHYLLLTLARRRQQDSKEGFPETSCGWMYLEEFQRGQSMTPAQLNIDVFRIRKQFALTGAIDPANIVERRPHARQLRLGTPLISIITL